MTVGLLLAACRAPEPGADDLRRAELDAALEGWRADAWTPAMAAAIVVGGEVVWTGATGTADVERGTEATVDTPFQLASVSKLAVAVAVAQAVERGELGFGDDVDLALPFDVDIPAASGDPVTVDHLLTHTSAIRDRYSVWPQPYDRGDATQPLGDFLAEYLEPDGDEYRDANFYDWAPGGRYRYSNIGVALAAYAVEEVTGVDFGDGCAETVFAPLGLEHTAWRLADLDPDEVAVPAFTDDGVTFGSYGLYGYPDYPDGLLRASVSDLARFLTVFTDDGAGVLSPASVEALLAPTSVRDQGRVVYAVDHGEGQVWGHSGSDSGVATGAWFDREARVGVVVLTNADGRDADAFDRIEDALFEVARSW